MSSVDSVRDIISLVKMQYTTLANVKLHQVRSSNMSDWTDKYAIDDNDEDGVDVDVMLIWMRM